MTQAAESIHLDAFAGNLNALRDSLEKALREVEIACHDLRQGNPRAALGALAPARQPLSDASALLQAALALNAYLS
jgi:hypothetical protein